jgi:hypothetical protein
MIAGGFVKKGLVILAVGCVAIGALGLASSIAGSHKRTHSHSYSHSNTIFAGWNGEKGSGTIETETRTVGEFTRIETDLGVNLNIHVGEPQKLTVSIDDNLLDNIITSVHGHTLEITSRKSFSTEKDCNVEIWVQSLEAIECNGSGEIVVHGLKGNEFTFELNGSGDFSGFGSVASLRVDVNGSGNVDARRLLADEAEINISGSGDVQVNAKKSLEVDISGSGSLEYVGKPEHIRQSINGSGSVEPGKSI